MVVILDLQISKIDGTLEYVIVDLKLPTVDENVFFILW